MKDQTTKGVSHSMQTTWMHQSIVSVRAGFVLRSAEIQLLLLNVPRAGMLSTCFGHRELYCRFLLMSCLRHLLKAPSWRGCLRNSSFSIKTSPLQMKYSKYELVVCFPQCERHPTALKKYTTIVEGFGSALRVTGGWLQ